MKPILFFLLLAVGWDATVGLVKEYVLIQSPLGWDEAQSYCRDQYKDLASISTINENQDLFKIAPTTGNWIGLRRTSDIWEWSDKEGFGFANWYKGKPYFTDPENDCGATSTYYPDVWVNYNCNDQRRFYCYRFLVLVKEKKTWNEALEFCGTHYTGLVSVTSDVNLRQVKLETVGTETESVWTGLRFINGQWFWVNNEQLGSLVSMPSCPDEPYRCGALNTATNTFNNLNCNEKLNFVCYWS